MASKRPEIPDILGDVLNFRTAPAAPPEPKPERIDVAKLRTDGGTQMRAALDDGTVFEYTQAMIEANGWGTFPAAIAYYDGSTYWLGDGFHRVRAYRDAFPAGAEGVPTEVRSGTRRDAILHAAGANASHGLRRTNADKRRAVETMLRDEEWAQWSDGEIARRCAVSQNFVSTIRRELTQIGFESPATRKGADGRTINTVGIGKTKPASPKVVEVRELEAVVSTIPNVKAATLRTAARARKGHWLFDTAAAKAQAAFPGAWNQTRLVNAMNNVADQMDQRERQAPPQPPVSPEQRQYDMAAVALDVPPARPQPPLTQDEGWPLGLVVRDIPVELLQRGWALKQVPGSGRYYCHNSNGPRATGVFDKPNDAIQAAYDMQVDIAREGVQQVSPPTTPADPDEDETIARMWNVRTAQGVLQNMAEYWQAAKKIDILVLRDPASPTGLRVSLGLLLHGTDWRTFEAPTLEEAVQKADRGL